MKAVRIHAFGGPEVLQIEDIARPVPAADEILVRVYASGVNPVDWVIREGGSEAMRSFLTLPLTLGWDAAGIVEETGSEVTAFQKGDIVYGIRGLTRLGTENPAKEFPPAYAGGNSFSFELLPNP